MYMNTHAQCHHKHIRVHVHVHVYTCTIIVRGGCIMILVIVQCKYCVYIIIYLYHNWVYYYNIIVYTTGGGVLCY